MNYTEFAERVCRAITHLRGHAIPVEGFSIYVSGGTYFSLRFVHRVRTDPGRMQFMGVPVLVDRVLTDDEVVLRAEVVA